MVMSRSIRSESIHIRYQIHKANPIASIPVASHPPLLGPPPLPLDVFPDPVPVGSDPVSVALETGTLALEMAVTTVGTALTLVVVTAFTVSGAKKSFGPVGRTKFIVSGALPVKLKARSSVGCPAVEAGVLKLPV